MKRKFKRIALASLLLSSSGLLSLSVLQSSPNKNVSLLTNALNLPPEDDYKDLVSDWYTIKSYAYGPDEDNDYEGRADLELLLSPVFSDYKNVNAASLKNFIYSPHEEGSLDTHDYGLIGALKYILSSQVKFIEPVAKPDNPRTENTGITKEYAQRDLIFDEFVNGTLIDIANELFDNEYINYRSAMEGDFDIESVDADSISSNANFLRAVLSYMSAKGVGTTQEYVTIDNLKARLGVDDNGDVINAESGIHNALALIYQRAGVTATAEELISDDIKTIFGDAKDIIQNEKNENIALAECFVLLQETEIPVSTMVEILGPELIKDTVKSIFKDESISPEVARHFLETITTDTCYSLCTNILFTKDEVEDAIAMVEPSRLIEIARGLSKQALDNIRIILGTANDNDKQPKSHKKRSGGTFDWDTHYGDFGNRLVNVVLNNMSLTDMINGVEAIWIDNVNMGANTDPYLLYSFNYTWRENEGTEQEIKHVENGRRLYLRNLIDFFNNEVPSLDEISTRTNQNQKETYHVVFKTAINEDPIYIDLTLGFQDTKDCSEVRRLAKLFDDSFDLTYSFEEGTYNSGEDRYDNKLNYKLDVRPQFLTNMIEFICNSSFVKNTDDLRLKERLFELANLTFGELKSHFNADLADQMIKDLGNLDYETALNTILVYNNFKNLFKNSDVTQSDINYFVSNLKWIAEKASTITVDRLIEAFNDMGFEFISRKLNDEDFKKLISDIYNLSNEIVDANISVNGLLALINGDIYNNVASLSEKKTTLNNFANLIYRFVNVLPDEFDNKTFMSYYNGDGQFYFNDEYILDWAEIFDTLPLGRSIHRVLHDMIIKEDDLIIGSGEITVDFNTSINAQSKGVYAITYNYPSNGGIKSVSGILSEGAKLVDFGPKTIEGKEVDYWVRNDAGHEGEKVLTMPKETISVAPIYVFNPQIVATAEELKYDGESSVTLTASTDLSDYTYTYQWQIKNSDGQFVNVDGATQATITLKEIEQSGEYRCAITSENGDIRFTDSIFIDIYSISPVSLVIFVILGASNIALLIIWFIATTKDSEDYLVCNKQQLDHLADNIKETVEKVKKSLRKEKKAKAKKEPKQPKETKPSKNVIKEKPVVIESKPEIVKEIKKEKPVGEKVKTPKPVKKESKPISEVKETVKPAPVKKEAKVEKAKKVETKKATVKKVETPKPEKVKKDSVKKVETPKPVKKESKPVTEVKKVEVKKTPAKKATVKKMETSKTGKVKETPIKKVETPKAEAKKEVKPVSKPKPAPVKKETKTVKVEKAEVKKTPVKKAEAPKVETPKPTPIKKETKVVETKKAEVKKAPVKKPSVKKVETSKPNPAKKAASKTVDTQSTTKKTSKPKPVKKETKVVSKPTQTKAKPAEVSSTKVTKNKVETTRKVEKKQVTKKPVEKKPVVKAKPVVKPVVTEPKKEVKRLVLNIRTRIK